VATRLVLVRHGETEWSKSGQHTGRTDIPLTDRGRDEALALRDRLDGWAFARVLCSPLSRALDTARLAGLEPDAVREDLVEWDYGDYEGRTTPDIRTEDPGWTVWTHPSPHGESAASVGARVDRVLADAEAQLADRDVVLVGHGHSGRVLIARYLRLDATAGVGFAFDPASVTVLGHERGVPRIDLLNAPGGLVEPPPPPADRH
jgi:probable phosphoglycerate mutase